MNKRSIQGVNVKGKTVLVRVDFNVPTRNGVIETLALGACFGTSFGTGVGFGIAFGAAVGAALGAELGHEVDDAAFELELKNL